MKLVSLALAVAGLLSAVSIASIHADGGAAKEGEKSWGYKEDDPTMFGPAQWGEQNANCDGKHQSPIDISSPVKSSTPRPVLFFKGKCHDFQVNQTEESYKASVQGGSCTVTKSDKPYSLAQFHIHAPSEHTLNGKVFDGEAHFVHTNADSSALLVVGLFLEKKENAETDPWIASVWKSLGNVTENAPAYLKLKSYSKMLAAAAANGKVFNYAGSLTTPACSEIVDWWVIQTPVQVSTADFDKFMTSMKKLSAANDGLNARPVQPLNGRTITVY